MDLTPATRIPSIQGLAKPRNATACFLDSILYAVLWRILQAVSKFAE